MNTATAPQEQDMIYRFGDMKLKFRGKYPSCKCNLQKNKGKFKKKYLYYIALQNTVFQAEELTSGMFHCIQVFHKNKRWEHSLYLPK